MSIMLTRFIIVYNNSKIMRNLLGSLSRREYCAPVWLNSAHTGKVDIRLNCAARLIISGTIKSTRGRLASSLNGDRSSSTSKEKCSDERIQENMPEPNSACPRIHSLSAAKLTLESRHPPSIRTASTSVDFDMVTERK